jgi:hypothetical protein
MDTTSQQTSPVNTKSEKPMWKYLFQIFNIFLALMLLIIIVIGKSIDKIELYMIVYLCLVVAIDNLSRAGNLASILYLFKRNKL